MTEPIKFPVTREQWALRVRVKLERAAQPVRLPYWVKLEVKVAA